MRKPEQSPEPSIEEILASIRQIIADDSAPANASAPAPVRSRGVSASQRRFTSAAEDDDWAVGTHDPYAEPDEPSELGGEDEILELTEDFMVEERAGRNQADPAPEADRTIGASAQSFSADESDVATAALAGQRHGLESVFSSVAAEVERLSSANQAGAEAETASSDKHWAGATAASPSSVPPMAPPSFSSGEPPGAGPQSAEAASRPMARSPRPAPKPAASRPVWSARHLENEGTRQGTTRPAAARSGIQPEPAARPKGIAERDSWAEGIQMPVPVTGPAAPPFSRDIDEENDATPPLSGSGEVRAGIEQEKTFVGEMLTRVFGGASKRAEQAAPSETTGPKTKAETLAEATVSDFASEMLRAPAVADALRADKPFMEVISDTLETALAKAGSLGEDLSAEQQIEAQTAPHDELPEALLPPDTEAEAFAAPRGRADAMPVTGEATAERAARANLERESARLFGEPDEVPAPQAFFPMSGTKPTAKTAPPQTAAPMPAISGTAAPQAAAQVPLAIAAELPGLEDAIKELIKPLIVQWLNENLPRIVEKAVREEIAEQALLSPQRGGVRR
ncbi:MAG: DUF2497 domain-containing protein [Rhodomicrobiaceae bacterium]